MIKVKYRNIISSIEWDDGEDQLYHLKILGCENLLSASHGYTIGEVLDEVILCVDEYYDDNGPENCPAKYDNTDVDIDLDSLVFIDNIIKKNTKTLYDSKYGYLKFYQQFYWGSRLNEALRKMDVTDEELKHLKERYIEMLWDEMRKRGISTEGISKIIEKTEFMNSLNEYPEEILNTTVDEQVDKLIIAAALV